MSLLTVEEVAKELRIGPQAVRRHFRKGTIPGARRIGKRWLIHDEDFDAWLWKKVEE